MTKKLIPTKDITLENVKNSNYWDLIAMCVWNHYSEERYQDNSKIEIKESWYGKTKGGSSHNEKWNKSDYKEDNYVRTLGSIIITFKRSDFNTYISINVENGNVNVYGIYKKTEEIKSVNYTIKPLNICNWMLNNGFIDLI